MENYNNRHGWNILTIIFSLLILTSTLVGCTAEENSKNKEQTAQESNTSENDSLATYSGPQEHFNKAQASYNALLNDCHDLLVKYINDIEWIKIDYDKLRTAPPGTNNEGWTDGYDDGCANYFCAKYKWHESIKIEVKIKDNPVSIPDSFRAFGHTLHFRAGGPLNPGFTTTKRPELCGKTKVDGEDTYWPAPLLQGIFEEYSDKQETSKHKV